MVAPSRPQFLLVWIVVCTTVLGFGLHLVLPDAGARHRPVGRAEEMQPEELRSDLAQHSLLLGDVADASEPQSPDSLLESDPGSLIPEQAHPNLVVAESVPGLDALSTVPLASWVAHTREPMESSRALRTRLREVGSAVGRYLHLASANRLGTVAPLPLILPESAILWRVRWNIAAEEIGGLGALPETRRELVVLRDGPDSFRAFVLEQKPRTAGTGPELNSGGFPLWVATGSFASVPWSQGSSSGAATGGRDGLRQTWQRWSAHQTAPSSEHANSRRALLMDLDSVVGGDRAEELVASREHLTAVEAAALIRAASRLRTEHQSR